MNSAPLIFYFFSILIWVIGLFVINKQDLSTARWISIVMGVFILSASIWGAVICSDGSSKVAWSMEWVPTAASPILMSFEFDRFRSYLLTLVLLVFGIYFFCKRAPKRNAEYTLMPLYASSLVLGIGSQNLIFMLVAFLMCSVSGFFSLAFNADNDGNKSQASFKHITLEIFSSMIIFAGILGVQLSHPSLEFNLLTENAAAVPAWVSFCIVAGAMLFASQIVLVGSNRSLGMAGDMTAPTIATQSILVGLLLKRTLPLLGLTEAMAWLGLVCAITAVAASVQTLVEREENYFTGLLGIQTVSALFLSVCFGVPEAGMLATIALVPAVCAFALYMRQADEGFVNVKLPFVLAILLVLGVPFTFMGWARLSEYQGYFTEQPAFTDSTLYALKWMSIGLKFIADLVFFCALWGLLFDVLRTIKKNKKPEKENAFKLTAGGALLLLSVCILVGGPVLGGLLGSADYSSAENLQWVEGALGIFKKSDPSDMRPVAVLYGIQLTAFLLGFFVLYADENRSRIFKEKCDRFLRSMFLTKIRDAFLWNKVVRPFVVLFSMMVRITEDNVFSKFYGWIAGMREPVRKTMNVVEDQVFDRTIVDGISKIFGATGQAFRLLQTGQVQYYFAVGILAIAIMAIRLLSLAK